MKQQSKSKIKERRKKGIVKAYMSRAAAIRQLQVSLADFRRLCILKGVYPVEPRNKGKLTGANTQRKTYFFTNDIRMLMSEPILNKFMEFKVAMKRLTRAKGRHDLEAFNKALEERPYYKLDNLVKERYPRFLDALRDCDDALSMLALFSMFPKGPGRPDDLIDHCRKLSIEFMRYVMTSKTLRKVFISIKGYYYQAEIMGQTITWVVPHQFVIERLTNVDLNVMKTFTEFYVTLMGFINFRLYKSINAVYPPQDSVMSATGAGKSGIGSRSSTSNNNTVPLLKILPTMENKALSKAESADQQIDSFGDEHKEILLERLFDGLKFFLNREVPRESLAFIIQSFGGEVSWDKTVHPGSTFDSSDPSITHHIVDRSNLDQLRVDRVYVQPQWVYDSINMQMLLPTSDYLIGATLPPHLSPFVSEKRGDYVPPDKIKMMNLRKRFEAEKASEERVDKGQSGVESGLETDDELEQVTGAGDTEDQSDTEVKRKRFKPNAESDKNDVDSFDSKRTRDRLTRGNNKSTSKSKMQVKTGKLKIEDKEDLAKKEDAEYRKMGIMMIPKKKKRLFDKITRTQKQRKLKTNKMQAKRKIVDAVRARRNQS